MLLVVFRCRCRVLVWLWFCVGGGGLVWRVLLGLVWSAVCIRVLSVLCVSKCLGFVSESSNYVPLPLGIFCVVSGSVLVFGSVMYLISGAVQWASSL